MRIHYPKLGNMTHALYLSFFIAFKEIIFLLITTIMKLMFGCNAWKKRLLNSVMGDISLFELFQKNTNSLVCYVSVW